MNPVHLEMGGTQPHSQDEIVGGGTRAKQGFEQIGGYGPCPPSPLIDF